MPSLKAIRQRIASVKSTKQVTAAMKMVAAAKLRKVQNSVIQLRPYINKLYSLVSETISGYYGDFESPFFTERKEGKILLVSVGANRGLCGAFNINIMKKTLEVYNNHLDAGLKPDDIFLYAFGKKVPAMLKFKNIKVDEVNTDVFDKLSLEYLKPFVNKILEDFLKGEYAKVEVVYTKFKSAGTQIVTYEKILPFEYEKSKLMPGGYIFEPDFHYIIEKLIPEAVLMKFYSVILDSFASEQAARMVAMNKATENAETMIKDLTLQYNKARQAAITKEILEVVSGAEALKKM